MQFDALMLKRKNKYFYPFRIFFYFYSNYRYPFYGTQFHPEKNLYEWIRNRNISHTENAIKMSQYFADFLGHEMRNTPKNILQIEEENRLLIYNFPVTFTALVKSAFGQSYMFPPGTDYPNKTYISNCTIIDHFYFVI